MNIVAFDTSTPWCSVALGDGRRWLQHEEDVGQAHSARLLPMISALLEEGGLALSEIEAIAFGAGPGSFTGVRIACGVAQGLALGLACPVMPVSTLEAIAESAGQTGATQVLVCTDARMGEVYSAAYRREANAWIEINAPAVLSPDAVTLPSSAGEWVGAGSGFLAYPKMASRLALMQRLPLLRPTARCVGELASRALAAGGGRDAQDALPVYVRDRVALTTEEREAGLRL